MQLVTHESFSWDLIKGKNLATKGGPSEESSCDAHAAKDRVVANVEERKSGGNGIRLEGAARETGAANINSNTSIYILDYMCHHNLKLKKSNSNLNNKFE
uniref:Uncharacterized protein n=1 Tax=Physcomitrium patens TaxID=3218 RepID=A0A2K1J1Y8_PHYPA|nr:hypothetical protein PHYPA_023444 [Physcomitrium patens]